jgi:photosystem II stability/assembly factor-like uncharacterized protein
MDEQELRQLFRDTFDRHLPGPDAFRQLLDEGEERRRPRLALLAAAAAVVLAAAAAALIASHPRVLPSTRPASSHLPASSASPAQTPPLSVPVPAEPPTPVVASLLGKVEVASAGDELLRSTDAGQSWAVVYTGLPDHHGNVRDLEWVTDTTIFAATNYGLLVSRDQGLRWDLVSSRRDLYRLDFLSPSVGYVIAGSSPALQDGHVLLTLDGGASWSPYSVGLPVVTWIQWVDATHAWAAGPGGVVATSDTGRTWTLQLRPGLASDGAQVGFRDALHGFALFDRTGGLPPDLFVTADGGQHWEPASLPAASVAGQFVVTGPTALEMVVGGTESSLCASQDSGQTWSCRRLGLGGPITPYDWVASGQLRFLVGMRGGDVLVAASSDAGTHWTLRSVDVGPWLQASRSAAASSGAPVDQRETRPPATPG